MGDMLSQAELDALLGSTLEQMDQMQSTENSMDFSLERSEILAEVGIETMEVSANTLNLILRQEVVIEAPIVEKIMISTVKDRFEVPSVGVRIEYKLGVVGSNILIISDHDAKVIASLMMGGDGFVDGDEPLNPIDESALCEAMNQMVGSNSTVMFKIVGEKVDIDPPKIFPLNLDEKAFLTDFGYSEDTEVIISEFPLKIGTLVDSKIIQIMPEPFANKVIDNYMSRKRETAATIENQINSISNESNSVEEQISQNVNSSANTNSNVNSNANANSNGNDNFNYGSNNQGGGGSNVNMRNTSGGGSMSSTEYYNNSQNNHQNTNARPVQFDNFEMSDIIQQRENISIIMDVPLEVTVEMGRTYKKIEEILEFSPGTIIELEKLAGDPIDILVNGKFVAKGEVVVIDENYGIRITDIINLKNRI